MMDREVMGVVALVASVFSAYHLGRLHGLSYVNDSLGMLTKTIRCMEQRVELTQARVSQIVTTTATMVANAVGAKIEGINSEDETHAAD